MKPGRCSGQSSGDSRVLSLQHGGHTRAATTLTRGRALHRHPSDADAVPREESVSSFPGTLLSRRTYRPQVQRDGRTHPRMTVTRVHKVPTETAPEDLQPDSRFSWAQTPAPTRLRVLVPSRRAEARGGLGSPLSGASCLLCAGSQTGPHAEGREGPEEGGHSGSAEQVS